VNHKDSYMISALSPIVAIYSGEKDSQGQSSISIRKNPSPIILITTRTVSNECKYTV